MAKQVDDKTNNKVSSESEALSKVENSDKNNNFLLQISEAEKIAETIVNSDTFGANFGAKKEDRNKNDVVACILLGQEIGIAPMAAVTLGKKLNAKSYFCVLKGKSLGLDTVSSIQNVSVIPTSNGDTYHIGVHVIQKVLLDNGVKFTILKDFEPTYKYIDNKNKKSYNEEDIFDERGNVKDEFFVVDSNTKAEDLKKAMEKKLSIVVKTVVDRVTAIRFQRPKKGIDEIISLSLQEATDAGWYRGYHSTDKDNSGRPIWIDGKPNWNTLTRIMLRNRVFSIGGNIVVADRLQGILETFEALELDNENKLIEETEKLKKEIKIDNIEEAKLEDIKE